jgi:hypothetical protein
MPISDKVRLLLDEISTDLCLAVQLENTGQARLQFERLERLVLDSLPRENPELLKAATLEVLRRAQRLATTNRQAAATEMSKLGAADPYQQAGRRSASWHLDG